MGSIERSGERDGEKENRISTEAHKGREGWEGRDDKCSRKTDSGFWNFARSLLDRIFIPVEGREGVSFEDRGLRTARGGDGQLWFSRRVSWRGR
jgi:hypothetical protein